MRIVLDTNCLLQILGARSPYNFLFSEFLSEHYDDNKFVDCAFVCQADVIVTDDTHFDDVASSPFPIFRVIGLDDFAKMMMN